MTSEFRMLHVLVIIEALKPTDVYIMQIQTPLAEHAFIGWDISLDEKLTLI